MIEARTLVLPARLRAGDEIRCVAPARHAAVPWVEAVREAATERLRREGFVPTFGARIAEPGPHQSSSIAARLADLHEAFADPHVAVVMSLIGGYNSNQLLRHLDFDLIAGHPKIVCGYSDITALTNAIHARTGLVTYSGPHVFNFGDQRGADYTIDYFRRCVMSSEPFAIEPSPCWSEDLWAKDQEQRTFVPNQGPVTLQEGEARGRAVGGNFITFMQLAGTPFWPGLREAVVFIEEHDGVTPQILDARLESLTNQRDFDGVRALVFGRFLPAASIDRVVLGEIVRGKRALARLPVIADVDCGHTHPIFTFPIGGTVEVRAHAGAPRLAVLEH